MKKVNVFMDMDGVLAEYKEDIETYMRAEGFFFERPPMRSMVSLVKELTKEDYEIYILSSVIDSPFCVPEKIKWLKKYLPEIKEENYVFVPYGQVKSTFATDNVNVSNAVNVLIDDYTDNLINWTLEGALPIKVLNGINSTGGTWLDSQGAHIDADGDVQDNLDYINNLIDDKNVLVKGVLYETPAR